MDTGGTGMPPQAARNQPLVDLWVDLWQQECSGRLEGTRGACRDSNSRWGGNTCRSAEVVSPCLWMDEEDKSVSGI